LVSPLFPPPKELFIDLVPSSIRTVELSKKKSKKLENYGQVSSKYYTGEEFKRHAPEGPALNLNNITSAIGAILEEARMEAKDIYFSVPDYFTFFTTLELPLMKKEELSEAVKYEAPRHIPLPISEVTLDWQIIREASKKPEGNRTMKVMLVAVPNRVIDQYQEIARALNLKIRALEAEVFALARAATHPQDKELTVCIIDIGQRSTTVNIVSKEILKASFSVDFGGEKMNTALAEELKIPPEKAEVIKRMMGIEKEESVKKIIMPTLQDLTREIQNIFSQYTAEENEQIKKIILSGGNALMPGLLTYFSDIFSLPTEISKPFSKISSPQILNKVLKKIGPEFTIAIGVALRGTE
ncbi:type IV pilus assembly protein PilM, partial [bacterium]|nr:type IV pilus assembly protein PilM [bacterium]